MRHPNCGDAGGDVMRYLRKLTITRLSPLGGLQKRPCRSIKLQNLKPPGLNTEQPLGEQKSGAKRWPPRSAIQRSPSAVSCDLYLPSGFVRICLGAPLTSNSARCHQKLYARKTGVCRESLYASQEKRPTCPLSVRKFKQRHQREKSLGEAHRPQVADWLR